MELLNLLLHDRELASQLGCFVVGPFIDAVNLTLDRGGLILETLLPGDRLSISEISERVQGVVQNPNEPTRKVN